MTPLDEGLLDDVAALDRIDTGQALRVVAEAGARVRRAARAVAEAGVAAAGAAGRPRAVVLAVDPAAGPVTEAVHAVLGQSPAVPVTEIRGALMPAWAGPMDALVVAGARGDEPDLVALAEQAYRRGCPLVAVAPAGSALLRAAEQARGLAVAAAEAYGARSEAAVHLPRTAFWPLVTALLGVVHGLGAGPRDGGGFDFAPAADTLADRLDAVAVRCRPAATTYDNPAKTLAVEVAGTLPVVWGAGPVAGVAATCVASAFTAVAGVPALSGTLPVAARTSGRLLDAAPGPAGEDDFFRDRAEEPEPLRLRVLVLGAAADRPAGDEVALVRAAADARAVAFGTLDADGGGALDQLGELVAVGELAAAYLALATGGDPAGPGPLARPGGR